MKKYSVVIIVFLFVCCCAMPVNATKQQNVTIEQITAPVFVFQKGDIDTDGRITASDARLCLRVAVGLETLSKAQKQAVDIFGNGNVDVACARRILRASVGLEQADCDEIHVNADDTFLQVGPFLTGGSGKYYWQCSVQPQDTSVNVEFYVPETKSYDKIGAPVEQYFRILLHENGTYVFTFTFGNENTGEVLRTYTLTVIG
ncbi:MAG: dockerin type I repeat-containing protein [Clostridia bacterium]|nr:dockerin type I repeat-containing protein [Clostridia bacterium]